jgi:hypothetical protein
MIYQIHSRVINKETQDVKSYGISLNNSDVELTVLQLKEIGKNRIPFSNTFSISEEKLFINGKLLTNNNEIISSRNKLEYQIILN